MTTSEGSPRPRPQGRPAVRRKEVLACLAAFGLGRGRWSACRPVVGLEGSASRRLRAALERLGPVYAAFGRYLASRRDLLPATACQELAGTSGVPVTATPAAVRAVIEAELGRPLGELFPAFDPEPFARGLLVQSHRAWRPDGEPVVVTVAPSDHAEAVANDLATLPLLRETLVGDTEDGLTLDTAIADFRRAVQDQADLREQARAWTKAAEDAATDEAVYVPRPDPELCTPRVFTREWVAGQRLADTPTADARRPELASRLCAAWLRPVMLGRFFPIEPGSADVLVLPDGRLTFTGGYRAVPASARTTLADYLAAAAVGDPDAACANLFRLMDGGLPPALEERVRRQFRQTVPPHRTGPAGDGLGDVLMAHWRLALAQGCRPPAYLTRLFRAVFLLDAATTRLNPEGDALRDGLETVRITAAVGQVGDLMSIGQLIQTLERYAPALSELPRRLDEALTVLSEGNARVPVRLQETAEARRSKNASAATGGLLLAVAAVALMLHYLTRVGAVGDWGTTVAGALVLAAGLGLLGQITGGR